MLALAYLQARTLLSSNLSYATQLSSSVSAKPSLTVWLHRWLHRQQLLLRVSSTPGKSYYSHSEKVPAG